MKLTDQSKKCQKQCFYYFIILEWGQVCQYIYINTNQDRIKSSLKHIFLGEKCHRDSNPRPSDQHVLGQKLILTEFVSFQTPDDGVRDLPDLVPAKHPRFCFEIRFGGAAYKKFFKKVFENKTFRIFKVRAANGNGNGNGSFD